MGAKNKKLQKGLRRWNRVKLTGLIIGFVAAGLSVNMADSEYTCTESQFYTKVDLQSYVALHYDESVVVRYQQLNVWKGTAPMRETMVRTDASVRTMQLQLVI